MTTVTLYKSTDASAPVLTGQVGSLVALLDACLINGYGSLPAAGWTKPFSASNQGSYRNSTTDGTGFYLFVDDTGPGGGGSEEARVCGFQAMTANGVGTGQFPTQAQLNIGNGAVVWRKSRSSDATPRSWTLLADDTVFYLFIDAQDYSSPSMPCGYMFGDFFSYSTADHSNCMIIGRNNENQNNAQSEWFGCRCGMSSVTSPVMQNRLPGHFVAASSLNIGGSILVGKHIDEMKCGGGGSQQDLIGQTTQGNSTPGSPMGNNSQAPSFAMPLPNPVDNGLHFSPVWVHHSGTVRGYFKGLWAPMQNLPLNHADTFSGTGAMAGKNFFAQSLMGQINGNPYPGMAFLETSSTWG